MTVMSADYAADLLRLSGVNSRIEHDPSNYTWTSGCGATYYLGPNIFKSLVKRGLITKVGTRGPGDYIEIYDLTERVS